MGIDITKLAEHELLITLGDGDWDLILPTGTPDLTLSVEWREQFIDMASDWFVRWVLDGTAIEIVHDNDPPWDCSGSARAYAVDPLMLLVRHTTLGAWMTEEYTGQSKASYESGMGLFWENYEDDLEGKIQDAVFDLLKLYWFNQHDYPEDFDMDNDPGWEELNMFEIHLEHVLLLYVSRITTADTWQQYERVVRARIEDERREMELRQKQHTLMSNMVQQFWENHFSHLTGERIEYPEFEAMRLGEILTEILADTDPKIVEAIAALGLPGSFSNKVRDTITQLAHDIVNTP